MSVKEITYSAEVASGLAEENETPSGHDIATVIRRSWRNGEGKERVKQKIKDMFEQGSSDREMYQAGFRDGKKQRVDDLTDIMYHCQQNGLGRMSIAQESNSHLVVKIYDCACCRGSSEPKRCFYMAGFLSGSLMAVGKSDNVYVREVACSEYPGRTCTFMASW